MKETSWQPANSGVMTHIRQVGPTQEGVIESPHRLLIPLHDGNAEELPPILFGGFATNHSGPYYYRHCRVTRLGTCKGATLRPWHFCSSYLSLETG